MISFTQKTWKDKLDPTLVVGVDPEERASEFNRIEQGIADTVAVANALSAVDVRQAIEYSLYMDAGDVRLRNHYTETTTSYGADAGAAIEAVRLAAGVNGWKIRVGRSGGLLLPMLTTPKFNPNSVGWQEIEGESKGCGFKANHVNATRFIDVLKNNDGDYIRKFRMKKLLLDANNLGGWHHFAFGYNVSGGALKFVNWEDIDLEDIRTINVPGEASASPTNHRRNIIIQTVGDHTTLYTIKRIRIRGVSLNGGNAGIEIVGTPDTGLGRKGLLVLIDDVRLEDVFFDTGVAPVDSGLQTGIQIGSSAQVGYVTVDGAEIRRVSDVGIENNNHDFAEIRDYHCYECIGNPFYWTNFNDPPSGSEKQEIIYTDCTSERKVQGTTVTTHGRSFVFSKQNAAGLPQGGACAMGSAEIIRPTVYTETPEFVAGGELLASVTPIDCKRIIMQSPRIVKKGINIPNDAVARSPSVIRLQYDDTMPVDRIPEIRIHDPHAEVIGVCDAGNTGTRTWTILNVSVAATTGGDRIIDIEMDGLDLKMMITNMTPGTTRVLDAGGADTASILHVQLKDVTPKYIDASDTAPIIALIRGVANLKAGSKVTMDDIDISMLSQAAGTKLTSMAVSTENTDVVHMKPKSKYKRIIAASSSAIQIDNAEHDSVVIRFDDGSAFTISNPLHPTPGAMLRIVLWNNSGGALGTITWGGAFKRPSITLPTTGLRLAIPFIYDPDAALWVCAGAQSASY